MDFTLITVPLYMVTNEGKAFFLGLAVGCMVRVFRAALRWFKRAGTERDDP